MKFLLTLFLVISLRSVTFFDYANSTQPSSYKYAPEGKKVDSLKLIFTLENITSDSLSVGVDLKVPLPIDGFEFTVMADSNKVNSVKIEHVSRLDSLYLQSNAWTGGAKVVALPFRSTSDDSGIVKYEYAGHLNPGDYRVGKIVVGLNASISSDDLTFGAVFADTLGKGVSYQVEMLSNVPGRPTPFTELPANFRLFQNYPNPFNSDTVIEYDVSQSGRVTIEVFNVLGYFVETLVDRVHSPGHYILQWNASKLSSGIYYIRLKSTDVMKNIKVIFQK